MFPFYPNLRASGSSRRPCWSIVERSACSQSSVKRWGGGGWHQDPNSGRGRGGGREGGGGSGGEGGPKTLILLRAPLPPCAEPPVYAVRVARSSTKKLCTDPPTPPPRFGGVRRERGRFSPPQTHPTGRQGRRIPKPYTLSPKP